MPTIDALADPARGAVRQRQQDFEAPPVARRSLVLWDIALAAAVIAFMAPLPWLFGSDYGTRLLNRTVGIAIAAMSLAMLIRCGGPPSLAHGVFAGVGAHTLVLVAAGAGVPPLAAVLVGFFAGAAAAVLLGMLVVAARGVYAVLVTVVLAILADHLFGAGFGYQGRQVAHDVDARSLFYIQLLVLAVSYSTMLVLERLVASADSATAAGFGMRLGMFTAAGAFAALGGSLLAVTYAFVTPDQYGLSWSLLVLALALAAGTHLLSGTLLAAMAAMWLIEGLYLLAASVLVRVDEILAALMILIALGLRLVTGYRDGATAGHTALPLPVQPTSTPAARAAAPPVEGPTAGAPPFIAPPAPVAALVQQPLAEPPPAPRRVDDVYEAIYGRRNWMSRHWHGDLSLGRSYWVNGVLISFLGSVLFAGTVGGLSAARSRPAAVVGLIFLIVIPPLIAIWQWVGVWRSAGNHMTRSGRRFWAVLARIAVVFGVLFAIVITLNNIAVMFSIATDERYWLDPRVRRF
jgi:ABC-type branched-subunit amino acid transport system permease subunit